MIDPLYIALLVFMTLMGASAALLLKRASSFKSAKELLMNYNFYAGGLLYFFGAFINIYILRYLDYSTVLPLTSITYIWTMLLSSLILKERIGPNKIIGVIGILAGAALIAINS